MPARFDDEVQAALAEQGGGEARDNITEADQGSDFRMFQRTARMQRRAIQPETIPDYFPPAPSIWKAGPRGIMEIDQDVFKDIDLSWMQETNQELLQQRAQEIEKDFYSLPEEDRLVYVAGIDPDDIQLLKAAGRETYDMFGVTMLGLWESVQYENARIRADGELDAESRQLEADIDRRIDVRRRLWNGLKRTMYAAGGLGFLGDIMEASGFDPTDVDREALRQQIIDEMEDPTDQTTWLMPILETAAVPFQAPFKWWDDVSGETERHFDELAERETAVRMDWYSRDMAVRDARVGDLNEVWAAMNETHPLAAQSYLAIAGGVPETAKALFFADVEDQPDAQDQIAQLQDAIEADQIRMLREEDYGVNKKVIDALGAWNKYGAMRLATGFALLWTADEQDEYFTSEGFTRLQEDIAASDYSPARALGLEKTVLGLMIDQAGGIGLDPINWIWGPKMWKGARTASAAGAKAVAKSAPMRAVADDVVAAVATNDLAKVTRLTNWLDEVGMADDLIDFGVKTSDDVGDVLGPGISVEKSAELRRLREVDDQGTRVVGATNEQGVGTLLQDEFNSYGPRATAKPERARVDKHPGMAVDATESKGVYKVGDTPVAVKVKVGDRTAIWLDEVLDVFDRPDGTHTVVTRSGDIDVDAATAAKVKKANADLHAEAAGVGLSKSELLDQGVSFKGKDQPGKPKPKLQRYEDVDPLEYQGKTYHAYKINETVEGGTKKGLVWVSDEAEVLGGIQFTDNGTGGWYKWRGADKDLHLSTRTIEALHRVDPELAADALIQSAKDPSMTVSGAKALNREIDNFVDNIAGGQAAAVLNAVEKEAVEKIIEEAMLRGATNPSANRLATGVWISERLKAGFSSGDDPGALLSFLAPHRTTTQFSMHGPRAYTDMVQAVEEIWGANRPKANQWVARMAELRRKRAAQRKAKFADPDWKRRVVIQDELAILKEKQFGDMTGSALDELFENPNASLSPEEMSAVERNSKRLMEEAAEKSGKMPDDAPDLRAGMDEFADLDDARVRGEADELGLDPEQVGEIPASERIINVTPKETLPATPGKALADQILELEEEAGRLRATLNTRYGGIDSYGQDMHNLLQEIWEDYNREVIAKNPAWADKVVTDKNSPMFGMVPWDDLRIGNPLKDKGPQSGLTKEGTRQMFPDELIDLGKSLDVDPDKLFRQLSGTDTVRMGANVPLSPIDMIAAGSASGAVYRKWVAKKTGHVIREAYWAAHRAWVIDKVMRPSTAIVVSFDEIQRAAHIYGWDAVQKYLVAHADNKAAQASAILSGKGVSVRAGAKNLPKSVQDRLKRMQEFPVRYREAERQAYEGMGTGWTDLTPKDPGYYDAARRWNAQFLQDQGFRAWLRGEDAYRAWFDSPAADTLRVNNPQLKADDAIQGWNEQWNLMSRTAKADGVYPDWAKAWREVAEEIEGAAGAVRELPDWVYGHTGTVRGVAKAAPNKAGLTHIQDSFFNKFFMEPTNFRRGFIHQLAREYEKNRLLNLYASQGKKVVTDSELAMTLNMAGKGPELRLQFGSYLDELADDMGVTTFNRIEQLAEARAIDEIDNIMYSWDSGSRAGRASKGLFPFGGPWADMIAVWSREMMTKPHLRGYINNANFMNINEIARRATDFLPFNPRTASFISRMANTDLEITEGWAGEGGGLFPGSERSDFSPLSFLPTKGDQATGTLIPGLGFFPTFAVDQFITRTLEEEQDPKRYQDLIDTISEWVPGMQYTTGPLNHDIIGGGQIGASIGIISDIVGAVGNTSTYNVTNFLGDIGREINRTREVSAILGQPGQIEDLLSLDDEHTLELALEGVANEADEKSAKSHALQKGTRMLVPSNSQFSTALDDVLEVWVDAADRFPMLADERDLRSLDRTDPSQVRAFTSDVRRNFNRLDQNQRDRLISQFPQLAVNLVASWKWSDRAAELGHEAGTPYRTSGTDDALALHDYYIRNGYIRPIDPYARTERILGLVIASRRRTAEQVYEGTAGQWNDHLWEDEVSDKTRGILQEVVDTYGAELGIDDPRTVWERWGSIEGEFEDFVASELGVDPDDEDEMQKIKDHYKIDTEEKAWSTTWGGVTSEATKRFGKITFHDLPPEVLEAAEAAGVDVSNGMTGAEIHSAVKQGLVDVEGPMASYVMPAYNTYIQERGAAAAASTTELRNQAYNEDWDPEWRGQVKNFIELSENIMSLGRDVTGEIPRRRMDEVREAYLQIMMTDDAPLAYNDIWKNAYERTFGPLDWEEPTPPPVFRDEDNQFLTSNAYVPIIRKIVDGDTIEVSEKAGPGVWPLGEGTGQVPTKRVRIIGLRAADYGIDDEGAQRDRNALLQAIRAGVARGDRIYLVRDPDTVGGNTDRYGRELAWLYIGDKPYYNSDGFLPTD